MQEIATISQRAAIVHGYISGDLLHPRLIGMNGEPGDIHPAALEMDEEQHVVGHQSAQRQHLCGEEVGPCQQRQMGPNERCPCAGALSLRRRRQTVASQDIADRLIGNVVAQIGQRPRNPIITPVSVLAGHANDQLLDLSLDARPARASTGLRAIELAGDKLAIPAQDGVRPGYGRDIGESLAAQPMTDLAERLSLGVREFQPPPQLRLEDAVLGRQVFIPRQQLLVHRPGHVGQDARPIHCRPLPHTDPRRRHLGPSGTVYHHQELRSDVANRLVLGRSSILTLRASMSTMTEQNKTVIRRFLEAWNNRQPEAFD